MKAFNLAVIFALALTWGETAQSASVVDLNKPFPVYLGQVVRVVDGDTLVVDVSLWPSINGTFHVRVRGIQAPEIERQDCDAEFLLGLEAKEAVERLYAAESEVRLENVELDSFGRVLADVSRWRSDRWLYLKDELIDRGLAVSWFPSMGEVNWCEESEK